MITKPEQAIPQTGAEAHNELLYESIGRGKFPLWFTAKETAEIACAYAESVGKYINALSPDMEREASDEMDKWQDRFIEWGWMK